MERDYDFSSAVWLSDLDDPADIGKKAGENTVRRLNPRKAESAQLPIVYDPRVASSLLGHFTGAINGQSVARGTTFLMNKMGDLRRTKTRREFLLSNDSVGTAKSPQSLFVRAKRSKTWCSA